MRKNSVFIISYYDIHQSSYVQFQFLLLCVLAVALGVSFIINMFVVSVFAQVEKFVISIIRFGKVVNGIVFHYEKIIVPHETETQNQW